VAWLLLPISAAMSFACKSDTRCDHPLNECATVDGDYCLVCYHSSFLAIPPRRTPSWGARKTRPTMSALLREIRQRRGRRD